MVTCCWSSRPRGITDHVRIGAQVFLVRPPREGPPVDHEKRSISPRGIIRLKRQGRLVARGVSPFEKILSPRSRRCRQAGKMARQGRQRQECSAPRRCAPRVPMALGVGAVRRNGISKAITDGPSSTMRSMSVASTDRGQCVRLRAEPFLSPPRP